MLPVKNIISVPEKMLKDAGVTNPKPIVYGAVIILGAVAVFLIYKGIRKRITLGGGTTSSRTQKELENELGDLPTRNATISEGQATIIAQNLLNAMDRWGTDEQAIIDNLSKAQNANDLYLIMQKFGVKPYDGMGLSDTFLSNQIGAVMKNLVGWLRSELSGKALSEVKDIFSKHNVPF